MNESIKDLELINEIKVSINEVIDKNLTDLLKYDNQVNFIEFELDICKRLNDIGRILLEKLIPKIYGTGYIGPRKDINVDSIYPEDRTSYRCELQHKERRLRTVFGDIKISRAIYSEYFSGSYKSFLDERLDIEDTRIDPLIKYWADLLGTIAPFEEAADILNKIRGINISAKKVETSTESMGKKITLKHEKQIQNIVLNKKGEIPHANINLNLNSDRVVYIQTDGSMVNTYEDWKECKTFMIFEIEKIDENNHKIINKKYFSTMGNSIELRKQLKYYLEEYCGKDEVKIVCVSDGANWIWKSMKELFPKKIYPSGIIEIIDFYHALERIGNVKTYGFRDEIEGNKFYYSCKEYLKKGNIQVIIQEIDKIKNKEKDRERRKIIDDNLVYFMNKCDKMQYDLYRKQGLCIGSGAIESANKYVVQRRVKLQGMKWNLENVNYMVHMRAEYINGKLDEYYGIKKNPILNNIAVT
jgi:hypothetical protein